MRLTTQRFGAERANLRRSAPGCHVPRLPTYLPAFFAAGALCITAALTELGDFAASEARRSVGPRLRRLIARREREHMSLRHALRKRGITTPQLLPYALASLNA